MANDKMNFAIIAQALKHQIRSGDSWDELSPAAKEALDQIATSIARTVSGDGVHWDGIIGFAQAARPSTSDPVKADRSFDYPYTTPPIAKQTSAAEIEHGIERLVRQIPRNGQ
jgi:hypothetical protein